MNALRLIIANIILLPIIFNSTVKAYVSPAPGSYDLNTWMAARVEAQGCIGITFDANDQGLEWITDYVVQHGECWDGDGDGINDYGVLIIELMRPATITDPTFTVYPTGQRITVPGVWRFGY